MVSRKDSNKARLTRHKRVRAKISGTPERPRLCVYRSLANISAQIIDDVNGVTLVSASSLEKDFENYGGNKDAARLAGLNPQRIITITFIMMGILCAVGGIIFAARMNSGQPAANVNLEFDAITAVILGGVSFSGGVGTMGGTIIGVFLIQAFNTGLTMVNVPSFWQYVAKGALLLFALTSDFIRKRNREKQLLEASKKNG